MAEIVSSVIPGDIDSSNMSPLTMVSRYIVLATIELAAGYLFWCGTPDCVCRFEEDNRIFADCTANGYLTGLPLFPQHTLTRVSTINMTGTDFCHFKQPLFLVNNTEVICGATNVMASTVTSTSTASHAVTSYDTVSELDATDGENTYTDAPVTTPSSTTGDPTTTASAQSVTNGNTVLNPQHDAHVATLHRKRGTTHPTTTADDKLPCLGCTDSPAYNDAVAAVTTSNHHNTLNGVNITLPFTDTTHSVSAITLTVETAATKETTTNDTTTIVAAINATTTAVGTVPIIGASTMGTITFNFASNGDTPTVVDITDGAAVDTGEIYITTGATDTLAASSFDNHHLHYTLTVVFSFLGSLLALGGGVLLAFYVRVSLFLVFTIFCFIDFGFQLRLVLIICLHVFVQRRRVRHRADQRFKERWRAALRQRGREDVELASRDS